MILNVLKIIAAKALARWHYPSEHVSIATSTGVASMLSYAQVKMSSQPATPFKSQLSSKNLIRRETAICAKAVFKTLQLKVLESQCGLNSSSFWVQSEKSKKNHSSVVRGILKSCIWDHTSHLSVSSAFAAAQQEKASRHQLHRSAGKHSAALCSLSRPEAVCPEAAQERSQPRHQKQEW